VSAEHSLDTVTSCLATLVVLDGFLARLAARNAALCAPVFKSFGVPIDIIPTVSEDPFSLGQAIHQGGCFSIIIDFPCCDKEADRSSTGVCDRV
jgi:hypothetical protein